MMILYLTIIAFVVIFAICVVNSDNAPSFIDAEPIPRARIKHSPIMSMAERIMEADFVAHVVVMAELESKEGDQEHRILIADELHHGSVHVSIPDKDADDNRIKGKADALIYALWVDEPFRKQGVARKLLETAERQAKQMGCKSVCLEWDRREDEEWMLRWYERLGYNEKELRRYGSLLVKEL